MMIAAAILIGGLSGGVVAAGLILWEAGAFSAHRRRNYGIVERRLQESKKCST